MKRILVFQTLLTLIIFTSSSLPGFIEDENFQFSFPHTFPLITNEGENYYLLYLKPRCLNMVCNKAKSTLIDEWERLGIKPREDNFKIWKINIFNSVDEKIGKVILREFDTETMIPRCLFELNVIFIEEKYRRKNIGSSALKFILQQLKSINREGEVYTCIANKSPGVLKMFLDNGFNFIVDEESCKVFGLNEDYTYDASLLDNIKKNHNEVCEERIPLACILHRNLCDPLYYTSNFRKLFHAPIS